MKNKYLTIDVGGTKVEICKFDQNLKLTDCQILATEKFKTKSLIFIQELKKLIADNLEPGIKKIGVSFNASVNNGVIKYSSLLGGQVNYNLEKEFSKTFQKKVELHNDVNAMALAESKIGQGKNLQNFVILNLGTGLKLSFVNNGQLITGFTGNAGEISQKEIIVPELNNQSFKLEALVSGQGLKNIYKKLTGKNLTAENIFMAAKTEAKAQKAINIFIKYLAQLLTEISYFYNPEKIIINGSLKKSAKAFLPQAIKRSKQKTLDIFKPKAIELSSLEHSAGLGSILD